MKILLIGASGQLGSDIYRRLVHCPEHEVIPLNHADFEITHAPSRYRIIRNYPPDVVINTAAFHQVEKVEGDPHLAIETNAFAPYFLAELCGLYDVTLVTISTDYVFGGDQKRRTPYEVTDTPAPTNFYGLSKLAGEYLVRRTGAKHYIVRTSGLYGQSGSSGKGGNFVETMLRLAQSGQEINVVNDQRLTPTATADLSAKILELIEHKCPYGTYHITQAGDCTWYEFAAKIFELSDLRPVLRPVTSNEFNAGLVKRPAYSVLSNAKLAAVGLQLTRPWADALADYLHSRREPRA